MTYFLGANNASTKLASAITSSQTTIPVTAGTGALFPSPGAGQVFALTLVDQATGQLREVTYCTSRTGDVLTVLRGQEGTTARAYQIYDLALNLFTDGTFLNLAQQPSDAFGGSSQTQVYAGNPNGHVAGTGASTGPGAPSLVWDITDSAYWLCTATGTASTATWLKITGPISGLSIGFGLYNDGAGNLAVSPNIVAGSTTITGSGTYPPGFYFVDTTAGPITVTLAATLTLAYTFEDSNQSWANNNLTIIGNGNLIGKPNLKVSSLNAMQAGGQFSLVANSSYWRLV